MKRLAAAFWLLAFALGCGGGPAENPAPPARSGSLGLPFSEFRESGDLVYLAGALGNVPGTLDLVPGGIEAQVRQTMENIARRWSGPGSTSRGWRRSMSISPTSAISRP